MVVMAFKIAESLAARQPHVIYLYMTLSSLPRLPQTSGPLRKHQFVFLLGALAAFVPQAKADIVSDMIGSWIHEQTMSVKGVTFSATGSSRSVRYGSAGLYTTATVKVAGVTATSVGWMHDSGACLGYVKQGTKTIAVMDGTWKVNGKTLITNLSVHQMEGDYTQTTATVKLPNGRLQTDSSTSTGISGRGTQRK